MGIGLQASSKTLTSRFIFLTLFIFTNALIYLRPTVVWGDEMDEISEELWADGQPDGPKQGTMGSIEFCVAVQKSQSHRKLAKLHDKLCNTKMSAVCEQVNPI